MRGFILTVKDDQTYNFKFEGTSIKDLLFRKNDCEAQTALSVILFNMLHSQELSPEKMEYLTDKILENRMTSFQLEVGNNHLQYWIRVYNAQKEQFLENVRCREDYILLQERFGLDKTFERQNKTLEEFLDQRFPLKEFHYDVIGQLDRSENGMTEIDFMEEETVIAKTVDLKARIWSFGNRIEREKIFVTIQMIINGRAMGLQDIKADCLKSFASCYLKEITFPFDSFNDWTKDGTIFHQFSEVDQMTNKLRQLDILDGFTQVDHAFLAVPNFPTDAINNKLVRFEFVLQIHVGAKEEFQFFIAN